MVCLPRNPMSSGLPVERKLYPTVHGIMSTCQEQIVDQFCDLSTAKPSIPPRIRICGRTVAASGEALPSSGKPAASASRFTRSRASCTKSENVVSATSWRGVKRSRQRRHAVLLDAKASAVLGKSVFRLPCRLCLRAIASISGVGDEIDPPAFTFGNDSHQPCAHAPSLAFSLDVVARASAFPTSGTGSCAPRASLVPFFAASASFGLPTFTVNR